MVTRFIFRIVVFLRVIKYRLPLEKRIEAIDKGCIIISQDEDFILATTDKPIKEYASFEVQDAKNNEGKGLRTELINLRVTVAEHIKVCNDAEDAHLTLSAYLRQKLGLPK